MPASPWLDPEFLLQKAVAYHHVVDDVLVVGACLISGTPTTICELKSAFLDKHLDLLLKFWGLTIVPHGKELHFYISEHSLRVFEQFLDNCVKDESHICMLAILISASKVLLHSLNPSNVIMGMCHQVDIERLLRVLSSLYIILWFKSIIKVIIIDPIFHLLSFFFISLSSFTLNSGILIVFVIPTGHLVPILYIVTHHFHFEFGEGLGPWMLYTHDYL